MAHVSGAVSHEHVLPGAGPSAGARRRLVAPPPAAVGAVAAADRPGRPSGPAAVDDCKQSTRVTLRRSLPRPARSARAAGGCDPAGSGLRGATPHER